MELGGSAVLVDVILVEGTDKQAFVDSFDENKAEWWNMLPSMPSLLVMLVEGDFIETLVADPRVVSADEVPQSFPCTLPDKESMSKRFTSSTSSSYRAASGLGEDNSGLQFYLDTQHIVATDPGGAVQKIGREVGTTNGDDAYFVDGTYTSRWTGKNVDIVTLESGSSGDWSTHQGLHDQHPDFQKLSSEDDSHSRVDPYWYQCTAHPNMKNTISINPADGTREEYSIAVSFGGSGIYTLTGTDRNGSVGGSNPPLVFQEGDTVTFTITASTHPFEIRVGDGGSAVNDGSVDNNGSDSGDVVWNLRTASRFTPMDWPDLEAAANNQVTSQDGGNSGLTNHGIGVLSVSGGTICGFAKKANLYAMYLVTGDSPTECIQALIDWHNAKPSNPETGEKNPTIMIAEYQYLQDRKRAIPVDYVDKIVTPNGTVNRPGGGSWGSDLSEFVKANIIPFKVYDATNGTRWCVVMPNQSSYSSLHTALETAWNSGIICVNAAGNNGGTYAKRDDAQDVYITVDATTPYDITFISYGNDNSASTSSTTTWYPHIPYGPHGTNNNIDVAAGYNSEAMPGWDGYSNRGPGITVTGLGANTYSSYQSSTYGSYKWGMFSGTSCATPTVVGKIACLMEKYKHYNGSWPNPSVTKQLLVRSAKNVVRSIPSGGTSFSWTNVPSAGGASLSNAISFGNCYIGGGGGNGGYTYTEAAGTPGLRAFFDEPDFSGHKLKLKGRRPVEGATYPRTPNSIGRSTTTYPELNV
ncbi:putative proximal tail fiber protein [Synechococcus phage S-CAM1]|uniref:Putative proximal tail fiber protein n=1 Tax=Synechococcus phage S-CAM1 TaxID=754037 RepID=A0A1D8KI81_9CAUD|nr:putative proximal tail fiber protein [Synechococcus phage S-CAM1]